MADVVALGELLVDFVCKETDEIGYPTLVGKPGGAPGNYLAAVKKYLWPSAVPDPCGRRHRPERRHPRGGLLHDNGFRHPG